jgi:hypothetical protein
MIAELVKDDKLPYNERLKNGEPEDALPRTSYQCWRVSGMGKGKVSTNSRLPWIHNK